jgi:hypothetical protein
MKQFNFGCFIFGVQNCLILGFVNIMVRAKLINHLFVQLDIYKSFV